MCGIFSLINLNSNPSTRPLVKGTEIIAHRGPDDEGYLLWNGKNDLAAYNGKNTSKESRVFHSLETLPENDAWQVGLGHRRLSIIDLSPGGHQPMMDQESGLSLAFNGEIYNYRELRTDLKLKGHRFKTLTDTEVLLKAWKEWGTEAVQHFNGMFAFVILDTVGGKMYAVRDRFGIKPLYYAVLDSYIVFASEIKQIKTIPGYKPELNESITYDYLAKGLLDYRAETFDRKIFQLRGGEMAEVDIGSRRMEGGRWKMEDGRWKVEGGSLKLEDGRWKMEDGSSHFGLTIKRWYDLKPEKWKGTKEEAEERFRELFRDSVRLRLRADVPVGSCLSGGLDSSAIVCQAAELLNENGKHKGQKTVTASYEIEKYDEWAFASKVIEKTNADPYRIWPTADKLIDDLDKLLWHMDEPFGSTSQFSQWSVFEGAANAGLKVMLDGQGADEMLAGYGGNDVPLYTGLLRKGRYNSLYQNYLGFKKELGYPPKGQLLHALTRTYPILKQFLPHSNQKQPGWLKMKPPTSSFQLPASSSLQAEMLLQTTTTSLPALLRYEDRNSMAFSIESRVPFLDHRFVEFLLGLPEELIYHLGIRKVILRNSMRTLVPDIVLDRKDKMGFVTPEEVWLKKEKTSWFREQVENSVSQYSEWFDVVHLNEMIINMIEDNRSFTFEPWRILCMGRWLKSNI